MNTTTQNGSAGLAVHDTALAPVRHEGAINAFGSAPAFEVAQRMAKALAASTMVPEQYRGNLSNCMIAIELASRVGCSVFQVMQHLYVVKGRPAWSGQFLIATINASGRFTPLRFTFVGTKGTPSWGCFAHATDKESGELLEGTTITMDMVKAENWGAKWQSMPEQMFRYRSAAFWARVYDPGAGMGMKTAEEEEDMRANGPTPFAGTVEVVPDAPPSAPADTVDSFLARIATAPTVDALKALSKEMSKLPADVGTACSEAYAARRAELAKPQTMKADPQTGELSPVSQDVSDADEGS